MEMQGLKTSFFGRQAQPLHGVKCSLLLLVIISLRIAWVLAAQGSSNAHIARELGVNVDTVRLWRDRWVGLQGIDLATLSLVERLQDAPRPGVKPKFTTDQRVNACVILALPTFW